MKIIYISILVFDLLLFGNSAYAAQTRNLLYPNGLEFGDVKTEVTTNKDTGHRQVNFLITLHNSGNSSVTILTKNLQASFFDYSDPPKELHIGIDTLALGKDGQTVIPPLEEFGPIEIKPGSSIVFNYMYSGSKVFSQVALVYDMLNEVSKKYGTWSGRIRSASVPIN